MNTQFFDVSDFVYGLERTGRAPDHIFLDDGEPARELDRFDVLMAKMQARSRPQISVPVVPALLRARTQSAGLRPF